MRVSWVILSILAIVSLTACETDSGSLVSSNSTDVSIKQAASATTQGDLRILPLFDVALQSTGGLQPGTIHLIARVSAHVQSSLAEISISAPDIAIAADNSWTARRFWNRPAFPELIHNYASITEGQTYTQPFMLEIPEPGYYRVVVTAQAEAADTPTVAGIIQNVVQEEFWLWVTDSGGTITDHFDASLIHAPYLRRPGPLTAIPSGQSSTRSLAPATLTSTTIEIKYINADSNNILTPVPGAKVIYQDYDQYEGRVVYQSTFYTDANGRFTADCPPNPGTDSYIYQVYAEDNDARVLPNTLLYGVEIYPGDPLCQSSTNVETVSSWARVFENLKYVIPASRSFLGQSRGRIDVISYGGNVSQYNPSQDRIEFTPSSIWGPAGLHAIAHEYGHAVYNKALGGLNPGYSDNCSPHSITSASSYGCALSEGFADFHATKIFGSRAAYYYQVVALQGVATGPKVEGNIAAFFFDLLDGSGTPGESSESYDTTNYPGSYLGSILKTCKYNTSNRASGADHIVYCLENSLTSRTGIFWADRSAVSNYVESATEPFGWSLAAIRNNWHWNIYRTS